MKVSKKKIKNLTEIQGIEFIDDKDPRTQLDMKHILERAIMYMNMMDPDDFPEPIKSEINELLVEIRELAWSIT